MILQDSLKMKQPMGPTTARAQPKNPQLCMDAWEQHGKATAAAYANHGDRNDWNISVPVHKYIERERETIREVQSCSQNCWNLRRLRSQGREGPIFCLTGRESGQPELSRSANMCQRTQKTHSSLPLHMLHAYKSYKTNSKHGTDPRFKTCYSISEYLILSLSLSIFMVI